MENAIRVVVLLIVVVLILTCVPLATIWALNTLFHLGIPYAPSTWAAAIVLSGVLGSTRIKVKT